MLVAHCPCVYVPAHLTCVRAPPQPSHPPLLQVIHLSAMVTSTQDMAFMLAISVTSLNIITCNFLIPADRMVLAPPMNWLRFISAAFYSFTGGFRA